MLSIVAGDVSPSKERQDRERARGVEPSTNTRGYDEASSSGGDDDELRAESEQEADEHAPERDLPRELPADREQLADHVEDRTRSEREERDEHVRAGDRVPDDRSEERRPAGDETGEHEPRPGRPDVGGDERTDDAEPLRRVVQTEADHEEQCERYLVGMCSLADREPLGEVVQSDP